MTRPELIIFDCDGVLVDSEVISTETLLEALVGEGLDVDLPYVTETYLGRSFAVVKNDYRRLSGRQLRADFEADFLARLFAAYRIRLAAMFGAPELIASLAIPFCMATSSSMERATLSLELTGLLPFFQGRIFSAAMVPNGKPAPDLFLHAAKACGVEPDNCLVIEDSEVGLLAARNAGMEVWHFRGGSHFKDGSRRGIDHDSSIRSIASMNELAEALRTL